MRNAVIIWILYRFDLYSSFLSPLTHLYNRRPHGFLLYSHIPSVHQYKRRVLKMVVDRCLGLSPVIVQELFSNQSFGQKTFEPLIKPPYHTSDYLESQDLKAAIL